LLQTDIDNAETPSECKEENYNLEELQMKLNDLERKLEECVEVIIIK